MARVPRPARSRLRCLVASAALALATLSAPAARADGRAELEKARASFLARNFADAEERLRVLLDPKTGLKERPLVSQARMYLGASLLAQHKTEGAKQTFEKLVLDDPSYEPDPLSFPSEAINTFIDVRSNLLEQIKNAQAAAARLAAERRAKEEAEREAHRVWFEKVKAQAAEEKITVRHSRLVASLPFGAGQFQNGQSALGWVFLGTELAALGGTAVTYGMYLYARGREQEEITGLSQKEAQYHQRAENLRFANLGFAAAFVAIAAVGVVQAHVAFVPERAETKKRELPSLGHLRSRLLAGGTEGATRTRAPLSTIAPVVSPLPGHDGAPAGLFVGIRGATF